MTLEIFHLIEAENSIDMSLKTLSAPSTFFNCHPFKQYVFS